MVEELVLILHNLRCHLNYPHSLMEKQKKRKLLLRKKITNIDLEKESPLQYLEVHYTIHDRVFESEIYQDEQVVCQH